HCSGEISGRARDQYIDFTEFGVRSRERRRHGGWVAHIGTLPERTRAALLQLGDRGVDARLRAAHHRDIRATPGEGASDSKIDTTGAASNEHMAVGEVEWAHGFSYRRRLKRGFSVRRCRAQAPPRSKR